MDARKLARILLAVVTLLVAMPAWTAGCGAPGDVEADTDQVAWGVGFDFDPFPPRESIDFAMDRYAKDPSSARARDPVSLGEFFGGSADSMNISRLRVELLKPNPRFSDRPVAFLHAEYYDGDMYWNNRYKDVQLFRLVDSTGTRMNPFPEAIDVPQEGSSILRVWTDYRPVSKGAPSDMPDSTLRTEVARIAVWSYVSGNVDGPASNGSNGGFARFTDASGRKFWRGVLIDAGAAWNTPDAGQRPWKTNILGTGSVKKENIPEDVVNGLIQIAGSSAVDLASRSRFANIDDGAKDIVRGIRGRAQEVLDNYGIHWDPPM